MEIHDIMNRSAKEDSVKSAAPGSSIVSWWKFFKERHSVQKPSAPEVSEEGKLPGPVNVTESELQKAIDPEKVIAWLITQPNAGGKLYLENVARQYMSALRSAPFKLELPVILDNRGVFAFQTPEELATYWNIFKAAPNYKKVNIKTSGMFSAGMACLMRYLEHLSRLDKEHGEDSDDAIKSVEDVGLEYVDHRSTGGALWVIGGQELLPVMLRLRSAGLFFAYKAGGGKSSGYKDAWWFKPIVQSNPTEQNSADGPLERTPEKAPDDAHEKASERMPDRPPQSVEAVAAECSNPLAERAAVEIWNENIGQSFKTWLLHQERYTYSTTFHYSSTVSRIVRDFRTLADQASANADTRLTALRRFISLLSMDRQFASSKGNAYSASLGAYERFLVWIGNKGTPNTERPPLFENVNATSVRPEKVKQPLFPQNKVESVQLETGNPPLIQRANSKKVRTATAQLSLFEVANAAGERAANLNSALAGKLTQVLNDRFSNGFRIGSPIELARFRRFASEDLGEEITMDDDALMKAIAACGTSFEGKVYTVSAQTRERIRELADDCFRQGVKVIFYSEFYAKNEGWLFGERVVSVDMLTEILRRLYPRLSFTQTYFGHTNASIKDALENEILRVWGDDVLLTYEQFAERLPYVPMERIKQILAQNGDFIWSGVGIYTHISKIVITKEERTAIREAAMKACKAHGYVSLIDLPFGEVAERNDGLSISAVHNATFRVCLSDKFDMNGKIVTRKGDTLDALTIMKKYCRTIEKCSLDDLLDYSKELTGDDHRWIPMEAGNAVLVRLDKDTYVADKYVRFNVKAVDAAIERLMEGEYLPLKSFTTFGAFPDCGQTWNLYLLESYCRRFSRSFRFDAQSVNSRNAGVVVRKRCGLSYTEIMSDAVGKASIPLTDGAVTRFLSDAGYTGRSAMTGKVRDIIDKAKAAREKRA